MNDFLFSLLLLLEYIPVIPPNTTSLNIERGAGIEMVCDRLADPRAISVLILDKQDN